MEVIKVGDVALRLRELPAIAADTIGPQHEILLDGTGIDPGRVSVDPMVRTAIARLPASAAAVSPGVELLVRDAGQVRMVPRGLVAGDYYLGPFATEPATTPAGGPLLAGMTYFNTAFAEMMVFDGTAWKAFGTPFPADVRVYVYRPSVTTTLIGGPDAYGDELMLTPGDPDGTQVYKNGLLLDQNAYVVQGDGESIILASPVGSGDVVQVFSANRAEFMSELLPVGLDTSGWVFDGIATVFPLRDGLGRVLNPSSSYQLMLSLAATGGDGRVLDPAAAYSVSPGQITFATAPPAGAVVYGSYGSIIAGPATPGMLFTSTETVLEVAPGVALIVEGTTASVVDIGAVSQAPALPAASTELLGHFILIGNTTQTLHVCRLASGVPAWAQVGLS